MESTVREFIVKMKDELLLFHRMDEEEVGQIVEYFELVRYKKGSVVFREGDKGDFIAFILSGVLEVKKQTEFKGRDVVLATLKKGSSVGEMSMIDGNDPRSATVIALEDAELILLRKSAMESLIDRHPQTGIKILRGLIQILTIRLRKSVERLTSIF